MKTELLRVWLEVIGLMGNLQEIVVCYDNTENIYSDRCHYTSHLILYSHQLHKS